jgi:hypothetical protein
MVLIEVRYYEEIYVITFSQWIQFLLDRTEHAVASTYAGVNQYVDLAHGVHAIGVVCVIGAIFNDNERAVAMRDSEMYDLHLLTGRRQAQRDQ